MSSPVSVRKNNEESHSCCRCSSRTTHISVMAALVILGLGFTVLGAAIASGGIKQVSFKPAGAIGFLLTSNVLTCIAVAYMILGGKKEVSNNESPQAPKKNWYDGE